MIVYYIRAINYHYPAIANNLKFTLAIHLLLCRGEITLSKDNTAASLLVCFSFTTFTGADQITLITLNSKIDKLGVGTILRMQASNGVPCPFTAKIIYKSAIVHFF